MTMRPLASLTSGLLARKGQAKPAMRPQGFAGFGMSQEDLGWNDMGYDAPRPAPEPPVVVRQREELAAKLQAIPVPRAKAGERVDKAAFTLRLDEERHLRLRLASAVTHRSSQQLLTQALDTLIAGMPELEELVDRARAGTQGK
jgi:hypothetical protein